MINKTVITTSTPVWMVPMIALPWLLLLIGILSVLVYIVIINGILMVAVDTKFAPCVLVRENVNGNDGSTFGT